MTGLPRDPASLAAAVRQGDRRALARAITLSDEERDEIGVYMGSAMASSEEA